MRKAIITLATVTRTLAMAARKIDPVYPGTAVARLEAVHQRLAAIPQSELDGQWPDARRALPGAARVVLERARRDEHPGPRSVGRLVPALGGRARDPKFPRARGKC